MAMAGGESMNEAFLFRAILPTLRNYWADFSIVGALRFSTSAFAISPTATFQENFRRAAYA
jgi:hypothetical protein